MEIKIGDYIKSDFASFIQGKVIGFGTLGRNIPCYKIKDYIGRIEYIIKGQANLWLTAKELTDGHTNGWSRHD